MFGRRLACVGRSSTATTTTTTTLLPKHITRLMSSGNSNNNASPRNSYVDEDEEEEAQDDFGERRARLQQMASDRKQRMSDRGVSAHDDEGGLGGTLPNEFVSPGEVNAMRDRLSAHINKFAEFDDRYAAIRGKLAELRQRSAEKRKNAHRQRRERRAKLNVARMSKSEQLARRDSAFVLQQNPWFNIQARRRLMLSAITLLSRRKESVSDMALRTFERRTK